MSPCTHVHVYAIFTHHTPWHHVPGTPVQLVTGNNRYIRNGDKYTRPNGDIPVVATVSPDGAMPLLIKRVPLEVGFIEKRN